MRCLKLLGAVLLPFFLAPSTMASGISAPTLYTCYKEESHRTIEAELFLRHGPGLRLLVHEHKKDGASRPIFHRVVYETRFAGGRVYVDEFDTVSLRIHEKTNGFDGQLIMYLRLHDPEPVRIEGLVCFKKTELSGQE